MTKFDLRSLLFKGFAIYSFLTALQYGASFLYDLPSHLKNAGDRLFLPNLLLRITPTLAMALAGLLLWLMSEHGSKRIFGREDSDETLRPSPQDIQIIAFSLAGMYLLAYAIPEFITMSATQFIFWLSAKGRSSMGGGPILVEKLIRISIGLWLLFGARGIVIFIGKIREASRADRYNRGKEE